MIDKRLKGIDLEKAQLEEVILDHGVAISKLVREGQEIYSKILQEIRNKARAEMKLLNLNK